MVVRAGRRLAADRRWARRRHPSYDPNEPFLAYINSTTRNFSPLATSTSPGSDTCRRTSR